MCSSSSKILIVAAHPDDEILGCGGTIARLTSEGCEAFTLILGEGKTSRVNQPTDYSVEINSLRIEAEKSNSLIGVKKVFFHDFPDNSFDTVPLLEITKVIEKFKEEIRPDIIFTHYQHDTNIDHRITYEAVITATRPMKDECVKEIYSFEVLSSTEWHFPLSFSPNMFFDISQTIDKKISAMAAYKSELKEYLHPRSLEAIKLNAQCWGMKMGLNYAEAFQLIRDIR